MKETLRRLSLVMIATTLVFTGCKKDQENNNGNGGNGATTNVINGHEYVDLGLPSGTKWATCNVGATAPEEDGNYYAWGEITTKNEYIRENSRTYGKNIDDISGNSSYDAACANWGSPWRMPTKQEIEELLYDCAWFLSIGGMKVVGPNGDSIFLPTAGYYDGASYYPSPYSDWVNSQTFGGYYWSSQPCGTSGAYCLSINQDRFDDYDYEYTSDYRYYGFTIRPVANI